MSDQHNEYWQEFVAATGDLVFITPSDAGRKATFLSRADAPEIANDRDRALLRAYLVLALRRLDEYENPLPSIPAVGVGGDQ